MGSFLGEVGGGAFIDDSALGDLHEEVGDLLDEQGRQACGGPCLLVATIVGRGGRLGAVADAAGGVGFGEDGGGTGGVEVVGEEFSGHRPPAEAG